MTATPPTAAQLDYIDRLCKKHGVTRDVATQAAGVALPLAIDTASTVIDYLKAQVGAADAKPGQEPRPRRDQAAADRQERRRVGQENAGEPDTSAAVLGATELRVIAMGEAPTPEEMTEDESWILYRLAKLTDLEQAIGKPVVWPGANAGGPIRVEHLLQFFGTQEAVAIAFGVSVGTVRNGWGGVLPANRAHEAAWLTRGYVQPPR